jgi:hypothetical protein
MRANRLNEFLQWFGLLGAALAWTGQHVVGLGLTFAACNRMPEMAPNEVGPHFGIGGAVWEMALTGSAAFVAVLAEAAAIWLFVRLRSHDNEPPGGRHIFFAYAAVPANLIFLGIILSSGVMSTFKFPCVQA